VRHRHTKGAATDMFRPTATAPHLDSTRLGRSPRPPGRSLRGHLSPSAARSATGCRAPKSGPSDRAVVTAKCDQNCRSSSARHPGCSGRSESPFSLAPAIPFPADIFCRLDVAPCYPEWGRGVLPHRGCTHAARFSPRRFPQPRAASACAPIRRKRGKQAVQTGLRAAARNRAEKTTLGVVRGPAPQLWT
jgi:hypothetical protein